MGSGSKTRIQTVVKEEGKRGSLVGRSGENSSKKDKCLFSFSFVLRAPKSIGQAVSVGDKVFLVPNNKATGVSIFADSRLIGSYQGGKLHTLLECMQEGYTYEGKVIGKSANFELTLEVNGYEK